MPGWIPFGAKTRHQLLNTPNLLDEITRDKEVASFRELFVLLRVGVFFSVFLRLAVDRSSTQHHETLNAFVVSGLIYGLYVVVACAPALWSDPSRRRKWVSLSVAIDVLFSVVFYLLAGTPESDLFLLFVLPLLSAAESLRRRWIILACAAVLTAMAFCIGVTAGDDFLRHAVSAVLSGKPVWFARVLHGETLADLATMVGHAGTRHAIAGALLRVFLVRAAFLILITYFATLRRRNEQVLLGVLGAFLHALPEPYMIIGADNGVITGCSHNGEGVLPATVRPGALCHEAVCSSASWPTDGHDGLCFCKAIFADSGEQERFPRRLMLHSPDRWVEFAHAVVTQRDVPAAAIVLFRDVTAKVALEDSLRAALLSARNALDGEDEILESILQGVAGTGFDRVRIYRRDPQTNRFVGYTSCGMAEDIPFQGVALDERDESTTLLLTENRPYAIHSASEPDACRERLKKATSANWLEVPLIVGDAIYGKVCADNAYSGKPISVQEAEAAVRFTRDAAVALSSNQMIANLQDASEFLEGLLALAREAAQETAESVVIGLILTLVTAGGGFEFDRAVWYARRGWGLRPEHAVGSCTTEEHERRTPQRSMPHLQAAFDDLRQRGGVPDEDLLNLANMGEITADLEHQLHHLEVGWQHLGDSDGVDLLLSCLQVESAFVIPVRGPDGLVGMIVADSPFTGCFRRGALSLTPLFTSLVSEIILSALATAKWRMLSMFASHDFGGPTSQVRTFLKEHEGTFATAPDRWILEAAMAHLELAADNLLRHAQVEKGMLSPKFGQVVPREVVDECSGLFTQVLKQRNCVLRITGDFVTPVLADRGMLQSIVRNVLHNAVKWADDGSTIEVDARASEVTGFVVFRVTNEGPRVEPEVAAAVNKGMPVPQRRPVRDVGVGFGLQLAREFTLMHRGAFDMTGISSGTVVTICIPRFEDIAQS